MPEKTLEEFVSEYMANKAKSNTKESYESWLRANGINAEKIYFDTVRDIESDYQRELSGHGSRAEALAGLGLTGSGYSDYLSGKAYSEMQKGKQDARSTYAENKRKNISGYQSYIKDYKEAEDKSIKAVVKAIGNDGIVDYDTAYRYAVSLGLSEESASAAAKTASDYAVKTLRSSVMKRILSQGLGKTQAINYALGLGLSENDANELGEYAREISKYRASNQ